MIDRERVEVTYRSLDLCPAAAAAASPPSPTLTQPRGHRGVITAAPPPTPPTIPSNISQPPALYVNNDYGGLPRGKLEIKVCYCFQITMWKMCYNIWNKIEFKSWVMENKVVILNCINICNSPYKIWYILINCFYTLYAALNLEILIYAF